MFSPYENLDMSDLDATQAPPGSCPHDLAPADPITGELLDPADPDALIDSYERIAALDSKLYAAKLFIREALGDMATAAAGPDSKTRTLRVAGRRRKVIVELPPDKWEQSILKEAWQSYPTLRDTYLRIAKIDPKLTEVKKLMGTAGPPDLMTLKAMLASANKGTDDAGPPTVKIEV